MTLGPPQLASTRPRLGRVMNTDITNLPSATLQFVYFGLSLPAAAPIGLGFGCEVYLEWQNQRR